MAKTVEEVLYFLESNQIDVASIEFDGHRTNIWMCEKLGVSFDFKPSFDSPSGNNIHDKLYVILSI